MKASRSDRSRVESGPGGRTNRWLRHGAAGILCGGLLLAGSGLHAEEADQADAVQAGVTTRITLNYPRATLSRVLDRIEHAAGGVNIKIAVEGEDAIASFERMPVNVVLNDVSWRSALDFVAKKYDFVVNDEMMQDGILLLERPHKIRMNVSDAPIENVIRLIAKDANVNVIIGPEVKGNVSFTIHDVPWRSA
ncbi:MAG: hypothetical protein ACYTGH_13340, partial [Planctomycetota bacterium]